MIKVAIEEWGLYNNGVLACKWWDADSSMEDIQKFYSDLRLKHGIFPHDDLELFNAEWEGAVMINEGTPFHKVQELNEAMEALDETDQKKIDYLMDWNGCTFDEALEQYEAVELYEDMTMKELAENFVEEGLFGDIPPSIATYLDYSAIAYDLSMDYAEVGNDIFRAA